MFKLTSLVLVAVVSSAVATTAFAGKRGTPATPVVYSSQVDANSQTLVLSGRNFGADAPSVILGGQTLNVQEYSDSKIIAKFAQKPVAATYRLAVTNISQKSNTGISYVLVVD